MNINFNINKNSHVPIYFQIRKKIKEEIENRSLKPGSQLPSERELSSSLGVSRVTIRKAIRGLITEGYCEKRVGKGIFVSEKKIPTNVHNLEGTTEFLQKIDINLVTKVISKDIISPKKEIIDKLNLNLNDKVLFLSRLRYLKNEPLIFETTYLSLKKYPGIENYNFEGSLYNILREEYNVFPNNAEGFFNIIMAGEKESELLNVQLNTPLLVKEAAVYSKDKQIIEYNSTFFRTDKFKFIVDSKLAD
ncbi:MULTISPECIES: GntR family transcriptional regulator [unclassified Halanaerobium]|uniref:GntR family transcriptional regulator n=1 Tax=unclassified Halanaerobium TaxID=2641197 RepID=UPI000DF374E3|nr:MULTISPECIES: GntR family transcriptional regulator [unclassified Halanaerobium]RCW41546.1 GntR family transcriptional regulator [Halanaerobium sp. MA284_MarDTE_T2]RCW81120.1 GntR family transcriptional regulator [Halanaerobium sp. DL-01]